MSVVRWWITEPDAPNPSQRFIRTADLDTEVQVAEWGYGSVMAEIDDKTHMLLIDSAPHARTLRLNVERLPEWGYVVAVDVVEVA